MAAASQLLPGINCGLYKNSATYATPTWVDQTLAKSAKPGFPWDFAEASWRETPVKLYAKTLVDLSYQVLMRSDPASTIFTAWVAAHWSRTGVLDLLILDSKITTEGATGVRGEFLVSISDAAQEIDNIVYTTFDLKPTYSANGFPQSVVMGASSTPSFSAISV